MWTTTPSSVLTNAIRQQLLNNWSGSDRATLTADLAAGNGAQFDTDLLSYMQNRTDAQFYFTPSQVASYISYIQQQNISTSGLVTDANAIVAHEFPSSPTAGSYTVQQGSGDIDWLGTTGKDTSYEQALNRQAFWQELATAYRLTGTSSYATELTNELASWSAQNPALTNANTWATTNPPSWNLLDTSIRAQSWTWTYSIMLGTSGWTAQANTLFLYKMEQTGEFLDAATPIAMNDNRAIEQYDGLLSVADLFPEFSKASTWKSDGHTQLFSAMQQNIYSDGSDREQAPGYDSQVLNALLDTKLLDQDNGYAWPSSESTYLGTALTAYLQMLSPNGDRAAIGDTYREAAAPLWLEADLVQGTTEFPAAKPRINDVWLFGPSVVSSYMSNASNPALPDRGLTYALPDAGDYMMRSGSDSSARQIIFTAGETGGQHGHFDTLGFELSGYGKPLIAEPGLVDYSGSADEIYAESTPAANTISADGLNTGDLEGANNPGLDVSQDDVESDHVQVTAGSDGYAYLSGAPTVARSIWYDYDGTMLVVDWATGAAAHNYSTSFNLEGAATMNGDQSIQSTNGGGDVKITPILQAGQSATAKNSFVSNTSDPTESPAVHYSVTENGTFVCFVTLVTTYNGSTAPDTTASLLSTPTATGSFQVQLTKDGQSQDVTFTPPTLTIPTSSTGAVATAENTSIAADSKGDVFEAFYDSTDHNLKFTERDASGNWSPIKTIDNDGNTGLQPSIAVDSTGRPGIAYYDQSDGDLKYAYLGANTNSWQITDIDSSGTVGQYPSLAFSRKNGAAISYYDKTHHALKYAVAATDGFTVATIDKGADVGKFSSLSLDPSRPTASKFAISYIDQTHGSVKYAIQAGSGWSIKTVATGGIGSYTSLAFDGSDLAAIAYYDETDTSLHIARYNAKSKSFSTSTVASRGTLGNYPNLYFDKKGRATVLYQDSTKKRVDKSVLSGAKWTTTLLAAGGYNVFVARSGSTVAYTTGTVGTNSVSVQFTT